MISPSARAKFLVPGAWGVGGVLEEGLCPSLIITPAPAAGYF